MSEKQPAILIILMGSLGDVARGLALVKPLRTAYPTARIDWLVEPACLELVKLHPQINSVLVFQRARPLSGLYELWGMLKAGRYDLCLDLQRHFKSGFFSWLSAAKRRLGFHRSDAKEFNWMFNNEYIPQLGEDLPKLKHYLAFISALGISLPDQVDFGLGHLKAEDLAGRFSRILREKYGVFVLGSRWESKEWPLSSYLELARKIFAQGLKQLVLIGAKGKAAQAAELCSALACSQVSNLVGQTSLTELLGLIKAAQFAVGPDSGPAHVASCFGVPYVTLFGPTSPRRVAPYGNEALSLFQGVSCAPCYLRRCPGLGGICMTALRPEMVFETVKPLLKM